jgi:heat shock protein HslJ
MKSERVLVWMAAVLLTAGCAKKNSPADHVAVRDSSRTAVAAPAPGDTLGRGPWRWVATQTPVELVVCKNPDMYTVEFLPDSTVRALLDCNRGSGRYHVAGHQQLQIGPLAATRMMCPPGTMDATFAQELGGVRSWFMQADTLMLDLTADSGTMRLIH